MAKPQIKLYKSWEDIPERLSLWWSEEWKGRWNEKPSYPTLTIQSGDREMVELERADVEKLVGILNEALDQWDNQQDKLFQQWEKYKKETE